jgi:dihydroorotate dehydrogenase
MSWFYRNLVRPCLFSLDSEEIHNLTMQALGWIAREEVLSEALASFHSAPTLPVDVFGLRFPNPIGLGAGMDKLAEAVPVWEALGFGYVELGGVTWHVQPGNPKPRMFRAIADGALINRMGFNNPGALAVAARLADWRVRGRWPRHPVGINLGKSKVTPLEAAAQDYADSFRALWPHADFFVVNVSSPNTPGLRRLQDKSALDEILAGLEAVNRELSGGGSSSPMVGSSAHGFHPATRSLLPAPKPVLVKVAPDLSVDALDDILDLAVARRVAGIVATNTTVTRPETADARLRRIYAQEGGLSGRPLGARSTEVIRHLYCQSKGSLPIIGVGGVFNVEDAWEKITAGASLLQVYTGLVFEGPAIIKEIVSGLRDRLAQTGLASVRAAVGIGSGH